MTTNISLHNITKLEILSETTRSEDIGKYDVMKLKFSELDKTSEITIFGKTGSTIEVVKEFKALTSDLMKPIDYLEDGCIVVTVHNECYVYIEASKKFVGVAGFFWLHNLDDNLSCGREDEFSYSLRMIYDSKTVKTLSYSEQNNTEESIRWQKENI